MNTKNGMCRRQMSVEKLIIIFFLLSDRSILTGSLDNDDESGERNSEIVEDDKKTVEEYSEEISKQPSIQETIDESNDSPRNYGKFKFSTYDKDILKNNISDFKPSFHLGEIDYPSRTETSKNPFNKLQHVKFENNVDPRSHRESLKNFRLGVETTDQENLRKDDHRANAKSIPAIVVQSDEDVRPKSRIKFEDDALQIPRIHFENVLADQQVAVQPIVENPGMQYEIVNQHYFQNPDKPVYELSSIYATPTKYPEEAQKYNFGGSSGIDGLRPQYLGVYDYHNYQPVPHEYETTKKPDNNVVYVQESSFTRMQKFPYPYYQPVGYHEFKFVDDVHPVATYPRRRRVSPWKKLVHLIGAFLPLGLLLASLTPNVVKIDNTTQPNIVLSKLRVADLPAEHKQARLDDQSPEICEDRSICELILAGGKAGSNVLQNALWNLATRTSEKAAKENGLKEIFEAARKENCTKIVC